MVVSIILVVDIFCAIIMKNTHIIPAKVISLISKDLILHKDLKPTTSKMKEYIYENLNGKSLGKWNACQMKFIQLLSKLNSKKSINKI